MVNFLGSVANAEFDIPSKFESRILRVVVASLLAHEQIFDATLL